MTPKNPELDPECDMMPRAVQAYRSLFIALVVVAICSSSFGIDAFSGRQSEVAGLSCLRNCGRKVQSLKGQSGHSHHCPR